MVEIANGYSLVGRPSISSISLKCGGHWYWGRIKSGTVQILVKGDNMFKKAEVILCVACIAITIVLGLIVFITNKEFRLQDIALLKMFYIALLNVAITSFIAVLRARTPDRDVLTGLWFNPVARAIFLGAYVIACALVIGK
jgi:hypothetical protein